MLRFICVCISVVGFLILSIPELFILWVVGKFNKDLKDRWSLHSVQKALKFILWVSGVETTVIGEEKIPDGAVLFVPNHRSQFDILLTYTRMKNITGYVAKKEMSKIPLLSTHMRNLHCLFLDRKNPREGMKTISEAINLIKQGISICIFPEGTRNKSEEGSLMEFKEGSFRIAEKGGCPIVPIAISNASAMFENQFPRIVKTKVVIEYCNPIYPEELDRSERKKLGEICSQIISKKLQENIKLIK